PGSRLEVPAGVDACAAAAAEPLSGDVLPGPPVRLAERGAADLAGLHLEQRLGLVALGAEPLHQLGWHVHAAPSAYFSNRATFSSTPAMNSSAPQLQSSTGSDDVQMRHHRGCTSRGSSSSLVISGQSVTSWSPWGLVCGR